MTVQTLYCWKNSSTGSICQPYSSEAVRAIYRWQQDCSSSILLAVATVSPWISTSIELLTVWQYEHYTGSSINNTNGTAIQAAGNAARSILLLQQYCQQYTACSVLIPVFILLLAVYCLYCRTSCIMLFLLFYCSTVALFYCCTVTAALQAVYCLYYCTVCIFPTATHCVELRAVILFICSTPVLLVLRAVYYSYLCTNILLVLLCCQQQPARLAELFVFFLLPVLLCCQQCNTAGSTTVRVTMYYS